MSVFSSIAVPRTTPSLDGCGGTMINGLFTDDKERAKYQNIINQRISGVAPDFKINKVKVEIFDLSDKTQVEKYEKLWAELLVKSSKMEAVVESRKDLVHRSDGTSYWMKYVEYVEFEDSGTEK